MGTAQILRCFEFWRYYCVCFSQQLFRWMLELSVIPKAEELVDAGLQIKNLGEYLAEANEVERSEISHLLLESVSFDLEQGRRRA